jgi:hypothetical protein
MREHTNILPDPDMSPSHYTLPEQHPRTEAPSLKAPVARLRDEVDPLSPEALAPGVIVLEMAMNETVRLRRIHRGRIVDEPGWRPYRDALVEGEATYRGLLQVVMRRELTQDTWFTWGRLWRFYVRIWLVLHDALHVPDDLAPPLEPPV